MRARLKTNTYYNEDGYDQMFTVVEDMGTFVVIYDNKTKVMYAVSDSQYNHGTVTLLVDENGLPLLYD